MSARVRTILYGNGQSERALPRFDNEALNSYAPCPTPHSAYI